MSTAPTCSEAAPTILRYETEGMARLRRVLEASGVPTDDVDTFETCLIVLEKQGFTLTGPAY